MSKEVIGGNMGLIITYPDGRKEEVDCDPVDQWNGVEVFLKLFGRLPQQNVEGDVEDNWTTLRICEEYKRRFEAGDKSIWSNEFGTSNIHQIYGWCTAYIIANVDPCEVGTEFFWRSDE